MIDTESLLEQVNTIDLISRDTQIIKGGRMYCPFCQPGGSGRNNSPALSVRGKWWHCFGCGASGDGIDYIMRRDDVNFHEACKRLGWNGVEPDKRELARIQAERQVIAEQEKLCRAAELDILLAEYSAEEIWNAYHRKMNQENRTWWAERGIRPDWQDYFELGYTNDKVYRGKDGQLHHSPAYTIPYFHTRHTFKTIQYRLQNPERPQDRYRFEHGLKATYYQTAHDEPLQDHVIICEGAIKSMVAFIYGNTGEGVSVLGVPAKETSGGVVEVVRERKRVWICLDPDCWIKPAGASDTWVPAPIKLAQQIGKAAKIVRLPAKVDDMMLNGLNEVAWKRILKNTRGI